VNEATKKRLALAHKIAPAYAANPKVAVVVLAGSVGRGTADHFSDIEIDVFWNMAPTDDERHTLIAAVEGHIYNVYPFEDDEWSETFFVEGIKVDTSQFLVETMDRYLAGAIDRADTTVEPQLLIAAIQHGLPLHGHALVERWRDRAAAYPDALVHATVARYLDFRPRFYTEMFAARDDLLLLYRALVEIEHRIMAVLIGLNRLYIAHPYPLLERCGDNH
jgi:predicted nucleotidyltransferase